MSESQVPVRRNNYKGKWLALQKKIKASDYNQIEINVKKITEELEVCRQRNAQLEAVSVTLASSMKSAIETLNEFKSVKMLSFIDIDQISHDMSLHDLIHKAAGLISVLEDRFGMCATVLDETHKPTIDADDLVDLTAGTRALSFQTARMTRTRNTEVKRHDPLNTGGIGIRGKVAKFEVLSPVKEDEVPEYTVTLENTEGDESVRETSQSLERHSSTQVKESDKKPDKKASRTVGSIIGKSRSKSSSNGSQTRGRTGKIVDYRASLPIMEDINWVTLRKQLNYTDQLYVRNIGNSDLYNLMVTPEHLGSHGEDKQVRDDSRTRSLASRLRQIVHQHKK